MGPNSGCVDNSTLAYLGTTCSTGAADAVTSMAPHPVREVPNLHNITYDENGTIAEIRSKVYRFFVNATSTEVGKLYKLCLVTDPNAGLNEPGWSNIYVRINPVTGIDHRHRVVRGGFKNQEIYFQCPYCQPGVTTAYLARQWPDYKACRTLESGDFTLEYVLSGAEGNLPVSVTRPTKNITGIAYDNTFLLSTDASLLSFGTYYHICIDIDGDAGSTNTYGDSRQLVYVTTPELVQTTVSKAEVTVVEIQCAHCRPVGTRCTQIEGDSNDNTTNSSSLNSDSGVDSGNGTCPVSEIDYDGVYATRGYIGPIDCSARTVNVTAIPGIQTSDSLLVNQSVSPNPYGSNRFNFVFDTRGLTVG